MEGNFKIKYSKKNVIFSCFAAYTFDEIFKPLIEDNFKKWNITLIISDIYFPNYLMETLNNFVKEGKIDVFYIYPQLSSKWRGYQLSEIAYEQFKQKTIAFPIEKLLSIKNIFFSSKYEFVSILRNLLTTTEFKLYGYLLVTLCKKTYMNTHKTVKKIINVIEKQKFDLVVLNYDYILINRYLLEIAEKQKFLSVNICPYAMSQVIQRYLNSDFSTTNKHPQNHTVNNFIASSFTKENHDDGIIKTLKKTLKKLPLMKKIFQLLICINSFRKDFLREYLYEFLLNKKIFYSGNLNKICFASGLTDFTVCYDALEIQALESIVTQVQNVLLLQHPSSSKCRCDGKKDIKRLLVLFSNNLDYELSGTKFWRWINTINQIVKLGKIKEVHLRLHPRTHLDLEWPKRLKEECVLMSEHVKIMQAQETPINSLICSYTGVLGTPSASLRVARFSCPHIFVLGITNCGDDNLENHNYMVSQKWSIGFGEGIEFISENECIRESQLKIPLLPYKNRDTVSNFLNKILVNPKTNI